MRRTRIIARAKDSVKNSRFFIGNLRFGVVQVGAEEGRIATELVELTGGIATTPGRTPA